MIVFNCPMYAWNQNNKSKVPPAGRPGPACASAATPRRTAAEAPRRPLRGNHSSNATCLTRVLQKRIITQTAQLAVLDK